MMLYLFSVLILLVIFLIGYNKSIKYKGFFRFGLLSLVILVILEFTLFNFRFYESLSYKEIKTSNYRYGEGIEVLPDGSLKVINEKMNFIEVNNINEHLNNVYINLDLTKKSKQILNVTIGYTDAANQKYSYTQSRTMPAGKYDNGEFLKLHLAGKSSKIKIYVKTEKENDTFRINEISFNKHVLLNVSVIRTIMILSLLLIIYIFRPKSSIYKTNITNKKTKKFITVAVISEIIFLGIVGQFNNYFVKENFATNQRMQYQLLAEAFLKGQSYLDIEPDLVLQKLRNPYDKKARNDAFEKVYNKNDGTFVKADRYYIWDAAYFNNKYYVYFGVAPVITYYLPFYALTGHHIKTVTCIYITAIATVIGIFLLLYNLCKKHFSNVSIGTFLAISLLFVNACGILAIMGRPDHYSLPILMAIMFSIYGLFWWLKAKDNNLNSKYLFLGSLCMAAVAACRPQLLLTSFFAIPIFWSDIRERKLFSKTSIKKSLSIAIPFVLIALLLMWYNYIRFGSIFDFGANYNLTTNDMTKRGFVIGRIPLGIFYYLFYPIQFLVKFPFFTRDIINTNYMGTTIFENFNAGFIAANLITIFGVLIFKFRKEIKDKTLYSLGLLSIIFSLIIIIADTQMAGILPRYICDFGFLIYFATAIVLFHLLHSLNEVKKSWLVKIIFAAFIFGIIYNFLLVLSDPVFMNSPFFFYLRKLFEFWV